MKILPVRSTDPDTSHHQTTDEELREKQQQVLACLKEMGSATYEHLISYYMSTDRPMQSVSGIRTRCKELRDKGLVEDTGHRVRGSTGRAMKVWRAV